MTDKTTAALFSYLAYVPPSSNDVVAPGNWVRLDVYNRDDPDTGQELQARIAQVSVTATGKSASAALITYSGKIGK